MAEPRDRGGATSRTSAEGPRVKVPRRRAGHVVHVALLVGLCAASYLPLLGAPGLWRSQEARVGWIVRSMLRPTAPGAGLDLITPRGTADRVFDDKPPLYHWLCALASVPRGVTEFSLRVPSAVAAALLAVLVYAWGAASWGGRAGLTAGLVVASTAKVIGGARAARVDILLALCLTGMLAAFWATYVRSLSGRRPRPDALVAFYAAAAAAALTKGPVLVLLPLAAIALFLIVHRRLHVARLMRPVAGTALVVTLCAWWYAAVAYTSSGAFTYGFFVNHHWRRYFGGGAGGFKAGRVYAYPPLILAGALPWTLFALLAIIAAAGDWRRGKAAGRRLSATDRDCPSTRREAGEQGLAASRPPGPGPLLLIWILIMLVFFSAGRTKRADYVLPVYPALALLVGGAAFGPTASRHRRWLTRMFLLQAVGAVAITLALLTVLLTPVRTALLSWLGQAGASDDRVILLRYVGFLGDRPWLLCAMGMLFTGGALCAWAAARTHRVRLAFGLLAVSAAGIAFIYHAQVLPERAAIQSREELAAFLRRHLQPNDRLVYVNDSALQLSYYVDRPAIWRLEAEVTPEVVAEWKAGEPGVPRSTGRLFAVMRVEDHRCLIKPTQETLGLVVVAVSRPSHDRPLVVLSNRPE